MLTKWQMGRRENRKTEGRVKGQKEYFIQDAWTGLFFYVIQEFTTSICYPLNEK